MFTRVRNGRLKSRHRLRRGLLALALAGYLSAAQALSLGPLEVRSALSEPLDAVIPITRATQEEIQDLTVSLAPLESFQQLGLEITPALRQLRFQLKRDERGAYYIQVSSRGPVKEPFLSFVLALEWPKGRLLREYTVLLDPPLFADEAGAIEVPPEAATSGESLPELAPPERSTATPSPPAEPTTAAAPSSGGESFEYGPVRPGETLSTIAQRLHPPEVTLEQMMIALYRANPQAFYGNINLLKAGSVLRLDQDPREAASQIAPDEALAEVRRQYRAWRAKRSGEPALVSTEGAEGPPPVTAGTGRLELVAPEEGSEDSAGGVGEETLQRIADLERRLALANEAAAAAQQENKALARRVDALEEQVAALQRLLALRDAELARLGARGAEAVPSGQQQQLAVGEGDAPVSAETTPAVPASPTRPNLWQDPVVLASLVGGGSLVLLGAWFLWYRRRTQETDEEWSQSLLAQDEVRPTEPAAEGDAVPSVPSVVEEPAAGDLPPAAPAPSENTAMPAGDSLAASGEIDPLAEADVYLAYGDYPHARQVLDQALEAEPERLELLLKRLEVAYQEQDPSAFCGLAERLLAVLNEDTDRPEWARVKAMGEDLLPDHPWFREHTQLTDFDSTTVAQSSETDERPLAENPDEVTLFAEDSDLRPPAGEPAPESPATVPEAEGEMHSSGEDAAAEQMGPLPEAPPEPPADFVEVAETLPGETDEAEGVRHETAAGDESAMVESAAPEAAASEVPEEASSLSLQSLAEAEPARQSGEAEPPEEPHSALEPGESLEIVPLEEDDRRLEEVGGEHDDRRRDREVEEEEFDGNAFFVFTDEVGTKLDLARAYIEMGDKTGARELLEEVLDHGDSNQQQEARELLDRIA